MNRPPEGWDAKDPEAFLGKASLGFAEWKGLEELFDGWIRDTDEYIKELTALHGKMRRAKEYGRHRRFAIGGAVGDTVADGVTVFADPTGGVRAGLSLARLLKKINDAFFPVTIEDVEKAIQRDAVIAGQLKEILARYRKIAVGGATPWETIQLQVDATAAVLTDARELKKRLYAFFGEAEQMLRP